MSTDSLALGEKELIIKTQNNSKFLLDMKKIVLTMVALLTASMTFAQNMAIFKAEEKMEEKDYKSASEIIDACIANPKTSKLALAYFIAGEIQTRVLNEEIGKAQNHQPLDTLLFNTALDKAVDYFTKSYQEDCKPDKKGRVKLEYADKFENGITPYPGYKRRMLDMLGYYAYSGGFANSNGRPQEAYKYFVKYMDMPKNPMFTKHESDSIYKKNAKSYDKIGYYAAMLAYQAKDYDDVIKYVDFALRDSTSMHDGYLMKMNALLEKGDTAKWVETSKQAIADMPEEVGNLTNLLKYYDSHKMTKEAEAMADELTRKSPDNKGAWYARGCVYMNSNYAEAHKAFAKAISLDKTFASAQFNQGVTYVNELIKQKDNFTTDRSKVDKYNADMAKAREYYRKAQPYFENALFLAPDKPSVWGYSLQNVYYNLQDGKQKEDMKNREADMKKVIDGSMSGQDFIAKYNIQLTDPQ